MEQPGRESHKKLESEDTLWELGQFFRCRISMSRLSLVWGSSLALSCLWPKIDHNLLWDPVNL